MIKNLKFKIKNLTNQQFLIVGLVLWLLVWAGYNTGIYRVLDPDFPRGFFDLIHGMRAFSPILAGLIALILIFIKKPARRGFGIADADGEKFPNNFIKTPIGLLMIFIGVGIFSASLSYYPLEALYWGLMYGSVLLVLYFFYLSKDSLKSIKNIINLNWVIASLLALFLLFFFLIQPGISDSLTVNSLICSQRPYEGLGGIKAETDTFGMAGTRPTGLGRYAGIAALVFFAQSLFFTGRKKFTWTALFAIFSAILLFSKGRAAIIAFILAMAFVVFLAKKINIYSIAAILIICLLGGIGMVYNIPCSSENNFVTSFSISNNNTISQKNIIIFTTLSGRTSGVWSDAIGLFKENPLFGYGFHADRIFLNGQHIHNVFLHTLVQSGILGTIPFVGVLILIALYLWRLFKNNLLGGKERIFLVTAVAVMAFIFIRGIAESFAYYSADWLFLAPIIAYIQILYFNIIKENQI